MVSTTTPLGDEPWRIGAHVELGGRLDAISCPSTARCFVVDAAGNLESGSPFLTGSDWASWNIDLITPLSGISCPSASLCVAVDAAGRVLASTRPANPLTWSLPVAIDDPHRLDAISCPSTRLCVAVDDAGNALVSTDPTNIGAWRATPLARTGALSSVSCTTAGLCVVGARNGSVYASAAVASPPVTWSTTAIARVGLSAVSCSEVGLCIALDQRGNAFESDHPASGRPVWMQAAIDAAGGPSGASCRPVRFCVAVDEGGHTVVGTLPAPTVATGPATISSQTEAQISATVDPNDANVAGCQFDYGRTTAYGRQAPCSPAPRPTQGSQAVSAHLRGLTAATMYHFRILATTGVARASGADSTFITPAPLTASPSIVGTPTVGSVLTCNANIPAETTPTPPTTITYTWLADAAPIAGATSATHLVSSTDASHHLRCQVSIAGDGATTTATSAFKDIPSQAPVRIAETRVAAVAHSSTWVSVRVTCSPRAAGSCTLTLRLTAAKLVDHRRTPTMVGVARATLAAGATHTITARLNDKGKRLLRKRHRIAVTLTVTGTVVGTLVATLWDETIVIGPHGGRPFTSFADGPRRGSRSREGPHAATCPHGSRRFADVASLAPERGARGLGRCPRRDPPHRRLRDHLVTIMVATAGVDLVCALIAFFLERHSQQTEIKTFGSAVFWTTTQLLTVSSQLKNPISVGGRILDVFMEIYAITVIGSLAASLGTFLQKRGQELDAKQ